MILEIAKVRKNDFLQQNSFSEYDYTCPLAKPTGMMKCIITYFNLAFKALKESSGDQKKSFAFIQAKTKEEFIDLTQMKFIPPKTSQEELIKLFDEKKAKIEEKFRTAFS